MYIVGPQCMIPVVMELRMRSQQKWTGLGGVMSSLLYIDMCDDSTLESKIGYIISLLLSL